MSRYVIEDRGVHASPGRRWQVRHVETRLVCPVLHKTRTAAQAALAAIEGGVPDGLREVDLAMARDRVAKGAK